jgi:hypothetical protein
LFAVANLDGRMIALKVVAKNLVVVAEEADTPFGADEEVCVDQAVVTVAERKLGTALAECVEAARVLAGLVANSPFVFVLWFCPGH